VTNSEGELVRVRHTIERLKASLGSLETALGTNTKVDPGEVQSVVSTAVDLGFALSRLYAYQRAEVGAVVFPTRFDSIVVQRTGPARRAVATETELTMNSDTGETAVERVWLHLAADEPEGEKP
jgi:hypothetical protein